LTETKSFVNFTLHPHFFGEQAGDKKITYGGRVKTSGVGSVVT